MNAAKAISAAALLALLNSQIAYGAAHLWRIHELYSNADGSIQFIEMREIFGSDNEYHLSGRWFQTNSHFFEFPNDLDGPTGNMRFLMGTQSYAAQPGVPAPDFIVPDNFFDPQGDTLVWFVYDTFEIVAGELPTDGVYSLDRPTMTAGINSPTNFAEVSGRVLDPANDYDNDGVLDPADNCLTAANANQRDSDSDDFGNFCDADLDNDNIVNFLDIAIFKTVFFTDDTHADLNGDGAVNFLDLSLAKPMIFGPPGPSGLIF